MLRKILGSFIFNSLLAIGSAVGLIFGSLYLLKVYTKNNKTQKVPNVVNVKTLDAIELLKKRGFDVNTDDSIYIDSLPKGIVLKQLPDSGSIVKYGRTVYLTVNRVTPPINTLQKIKHRSLNEVVKMLLRNNMKIGDTNYKPDFMRGAVLMAFVDGVPLADSGARVRWGSTVDLLVGGGMEDKVITTPNLLGLTFGEAKQVLEQSGFTVGYPIVDPGVTDTNNAFVYRQNPNTFTDDSIKIFLRPGAIVDLWISAENKFGFRRNVSDVVVEQGEAPQPIDPDDDEEDDEAKTFDKSGIRTGSKKTNKPKQTQKKTKDKKQNKTDQETNPSGEPQQPKEPAPEPPKKEEGDGKKNDGNFK